MEPLEHDCSRAGTLIDPPLMKTPKLFSAIPLGAAICLQFLCHTAFADRILLELKEAASFGSGASTSDDLYSPGGIKGVGLFVGEPNNSSRKDRVLLKYNIETLLLKTKKIQSAELRFTIDYFVSLDPKQELEVEHLSDSIEVLGGRDLNRNDAESLGIIEITKDDAVNADEGRNSPAAMTKTMDVTAAIKEDLAKGLTATVLRLKAPGIESGPNTAQAHGLILTSDVGKRPVLVITLQD
jgi:hypothetical protein